MLPHPPEFDAQNVFTAHPDPYLWLFQITNPSGGPIKDVDGSDRVLRVTPNSAPVQFGSGAGGPLTWDPYPIGFDELVRDDDGGVSAISLSVSMAAGMAMKVMRANDMFRRHIVTMHLVHSAFLDNPAMKATVVTTVTDVSANWIAATLTLGAFDVVGFSVPQSLATQRCRWTYRGFGCDFTGDPGNVELGACSKTLAACRRRGQWEIDNGLATSFADALHPRRFGGLPGLPSGSFPVVT